MSAKPVHCFSRGNWDVSVIFGETERMFRWAKEGFFAVVDFGRMDAAKSVLHDDASDDSGVIEQLTMEADCGGIFDCSDEAVAIKAGLIQPEREDDELIELQAYREERYLHHEYQMASGVFKN